MLVGIRLSVFDVLRLGLAGLPVVLAAIATGLVFVTWFNRRLGLPPRLGTLIAAGTSICGVTAIVSTAPAIDADEREVAYAVANVVAFGLFGMLAYPYLAHALLPRSETVGLFLGTAVHDTSQVVGAALTYRQMYARRCRAARRDGDQADAQPVPGGRHSAPHLDARCANRTSARRSHGRPPLDDSSCRCFVVGFVAMAVVRSIGDATLQSTGAAYGVWDAAAWKQLTDWIGDFWASRMLLGTAMAAVGLNTSFAVFKGVGAQAVRRRPGRRARRGRGRHADGHCLRPVCHALTR